MSHAAGEVISADVRQPIGVLGYFEYDGCADVVIPPIWVSQEELSANWRKGVERKCVCGNSPVSVILYSSYGGGFFWRGRACLECSVIIDPLCPWDYDEVEIIDGHPIKGSGRVLKKAVYYR